MKLENVAWRRGGCVRAEYPRAQADLDGDDGAGAQLRCEACSGGEDELAEGRHGDESKVPLGELDKRIERLG